MHHQSKRHELGQISGDGGGREACIQQSICCKESEQTGRLNNKSAVMKMVQNEECHNARKDHLYC